MKFELFAERQAQNTQYFCAVLLSRPTRGEWIEMSLITYVTDRKGHDMRYAIDPAKIHNELDWQPETNFEDGIKKTVQWYLDNREWWENIISGEYQGYYDKMYGNSVST